MSDLTLTKKDEDELLDPEPVELTEFDEAYNAQLNLLPAKTRIIVEKIAWQIRHEGLTVEEACLVTNVDFEWLEKAIEEYPIIARVMAKKELQYKMKLTKPLRGKAKHDDSMAKYLLELRFPQQKIKGSQTPDDSGDMLAAAITHIQENGDSTPLVSKSSGKAVVFAKGKSAAKIIQQIQGFLK